MPSLRSLTRAIARNGTTVQLQRPTGGASAFVPATVRGYQPEELVGDVVQGDRELRIAAPALAATGWPVPPKRQDVAAIDGVTTAVQSVETAYLRGHAAQYILRVRG